MSNIFDFFNPLSWLNPFHLSGLVLTGIIAAMITLKSVANVVSNLVEVVTPALKAVVEAIVWVFKELFQGVGVCLANLSTLTVIIAAIIFGGWYFKTWDNQAIIDKYEKQIVDLKKLQCKPFPTKKR